MALNHTGRVIYAYTIELSLKIDPPAKSALCDKALFT